MRNVVVTKRMKISQARGAVDVHIKEILRDNFMTLKTQQ
jgi:hypothetical protein